MSDKILFNDLNGMLEAANKKGYEILEIQLNAGDLLSVVTNDEMYAKIKSFAFRVGNGNRLALICSGPTIDRIG